MASSVEPSSAATPAPAPTPPPSAAEPARPAATPPADRFERTEPTAFAVATPSATATPAADAATPTPPPAPATPQSDRKERELRDTYAQNARARDALDTLVADADYQRLDDAQRLGLLSQFQQAPNRATAYRLEGVAGFLAHSATQRLLSPEWFEGANRLVNAAFPDAGSLTFNGNTYTIENGALLDAQGNRAGIIRNDGTFQLDNETTARDFYREINARVHLEETIDGNRQTLLDLYPVDPGNYLANASINPTFRAHVESTIADLRREGLNMRVVSGFRSFQEQNALYNQGRNGNPGQVVTNARGGQSWHNYGLAVDMTFLDQNGRITWQTGGDYAPLWQRYGQLGQANGLEWGGSWQDFQDLPHLEFHPGLTAQQAGTLIPAYNRNGLEGAWDQMGIGAQP